MLICCFQVPSFTAATARHIENLSTDVQEMKEDLIEFKDFVAENFTEINSKLDLILRVLHPLKPTALKRKADNDGNTDDEFRNQRARQESYDDAPAQSAAPPAKKSTTLANPRNLTDDLCQTSIELLF